MRILSKVGISVVLLPFVLIGLCAVCASIDFFKFNVLSWRFITDERIVTGGALDQDGLLKCVVVLVFSFAFHLSVLAMQRLWVKLPSRWFRIVLYAPLAGLLIPQIGLWVSYHWYLTRYIHVMGWTFDRFLGLVCGIALFSCCVFMFAKLAKKMCVPDDYSSRKCAR